MAYLPLRYYCCCGLQQQQQGHRRVLLIPNGVAKWIFCLLGVGILVPWNAFISAVPYFQARICTLPNASEQFESLVGLFFNLSSVLALVGLLSWPYIQEKHHRARRRGRGHDEEIISSSDHDGSLQLHYPQQQPAISTTTTIISNDNHDVDNTTSLTPTTSTSHSFWLVTLPLVLYLVVFSVTDLLVLVQDISPRLFLALTLLGVMLCGACTAFCQAGIVAFCSNYFPAHIGINPFVAGQAVGGVAVSFANFISATAEDPQLYWNQHCMANNTATTLLSALVNGDQQDEWNNNNNNNKLNNNGAEGMPIMTRTEPSSTMVRALIGICPPYETPDKAVFMYFFLGAIVLLGCVVGFTLLDHSTTTNAQYQPPQQQNDEQEQYESAMARVHHHQDDQTGQQSVPSEREVFRDEGEDDDELPSPGNGGLEMPPSHQHATAYTVASKSSTTTAAAALSARSEQNACLERNLGRYQEDTADPAASNGGTTSDGILLFRRLSSHHSSSDALVVVAAEEATDARVHDGTATNNDVLGVLVAVKGPAFCIFFTFLVTLALFPSWTSRTHSVHQCQTTPATDPSHLWVRLRNDLFTPFTFVVFNLGDLIGRLVAGIIPAARIERFSTKLVLAAASRCLLVPMLILCVGGDDATTAGHRLQIESDLYSVLVQSLFALSNGCLISLAFSHAPSLLTSSTSESQEKSSEILTFSLSSGLLVGSLLSFAVAKLATSSSQL